MNFKYMLFLWLSGVFGVVCGKIFIPDATGEMFADQLILSGVITILCYMFMKDIIKRNKP